MELRTETQKTEHRAAEYIAPEPPLDGAWFPPEEFSARRARVYDAIGAGAVAVLQGAGPVAGFEDFRQTNDFHYLTGLDVPQCYLLLDGARRSASLYLPPPDPHAKSEGGMLSCEDGDIVKAKTGVEGVYGWEAMAYDLSGASIVYVPQGPAEGRTACRDTLTAAARRIAADPWDGEPSREARFRQNLEKRFPGVEWRDLTPILDEMRLYKSAREVNVLRWTGFLSAKAVIEAMRATRPGVREFELWAIGDYVFRVNGARREGYRPIIPTGGNIWHSHYYRNDAELREGDLVLMDYAPDISNYTSDIGRMWPVGGRYQPWQRELYGFMVRYHKALLRRIRPGLTPDAILADAAAEMEAVIRDEGFSRPEFERAARRCLEFRGHLSHPVGMAVHDVGSYFDREMAPGLVITVDPQMWIPEECLYIRVEDTVAVTEDGVEILTAAAPLELDDVEALVGGTGMLQQFPTSIANGSGNGDGNADGAGHRTEEALA